MTLNQDIRWKQHFQNFDRASANNNKALDCRSLSATYRLFPATLRSRLNINFITVTVASLRYACGAKQPISPVFAKPNGLKQSSSNINRLHSAPLSRLQPFWIATSVTPSREDGSGVVAKSLGLRQPIFTPSSRNGIFTNANGVRQSNEN